MGLKEDLAALLAHFEGGEDELKERIELIKAGYSKSDEDLKTEEAVIKQLEQFCASHIAESRGYFTGKTPQQITALQGALAAYRAQPAFEKQYKELATARQAVVSSYRSSLEPAERNVNAAIEAGLKMFTPDSQLQAGQNNYQDNGVKHLLLQFVDLTLAKLLAPHRASLQLTPAINLDENIQSVQAQLQARLLDSNGGAALAALLAGLEELCSKQCLPLRQQELSALADKDKQLKEILDSRTRAVKNLPRTWADWSAVVTATLRQIPNNTTSLWGILQKEIQPKERKEHQALSRAQYGEKELKKSVESHKRKISELEESVRDGNDDARSIGSRGSSRMTTQTFRFAGKEGNPMDDFYVLCQFWHPARIQVINILATELRSLQPAADDMADMSMVSIDTDASETVTVEQLQPLLKLLITEKITPYEAVKQFQELRFAKKTVAYSTIMTNIEMGILQLAIDAVDPKPGFGIEDINTPLDAFYRVEKINAICEALRDNGENSLLPFDTALADELATAEKALTEKYPQILLPNFQEGCMTKLVLDGQKKFKATMLQAANHSNGHGGNASQQQTGSYFSFLGGFGFGSPTKGATAAMGGLSMNGNGGGELVYKKK